jgi:hypothetical protein
LEILGTGKCETFIWLAVCNRCWTTDRLQKRGLPHPEHCPLCDQEDETVQHLLTSYVFARQFWFSILQPLNLSALVPNQKCTLLAEWWKKSWRKIPTQHKKGFNSLVILRAWTLLKHRNACVFDGATPNIQRALQAFQDELALWRSAGAKGLTALGLGRVVQYFSPCALVVRSCNYFSL